MKPPTLEEVRRLPKARKASFQGPINLGGAKVLNNYLDPEKFSLHVDVANRMAYLVESGDADPYGYENVPWENLAHWSWQAPALEETPKKGKGEKAEQRAEA